MLLKIYQLNLVKKRSKINITKEQLIEAVKDESHVIQSLAIQLHKRLSQMIMKRKRKVNYNDFKYNYFLRSLNSYLNKYIKLKEI